MSCDDHGHDRFVRKEFTLPGGDGIELLVERREGTKRRCCYEVVRFKGNTTDIIDSEFVGTYREAVRLFEEACVSGWPSGVPQESREVAGSRTSSGVNCG